MTRADAGPALTARGLRKGYKDLVAVDGVDLDLARGECLALLGPNGAGKTTTVEMLEGLTIPDAGTVEILGKPLLKHRRELMARVGVVLQETSLYKRYTVEETLSLFASFFPTCVEPATIMERLSLLDKRDVQIRHLSGGQKQRVYLGCALINDPELLFLDEPTTGLDPQARRATWDLIDGLKREGKSILLTTHYMEEAEVLADRVAVIDKGRIIAQGTPDALIRETAGTQILWVELAGAAGDTHPLLLERMSSTLPWFAEATLAQGGFELMAGDATEQARAIFAAAAAANLTVVRLEIRRSTLEDVFLKLTGRSMRNG